MKRYRVYRRDGGNQGVLAESPRAALLKVQARLPRGARVGGVEAIDGSVSVDVVAWCEACEGPILDGDEYDTDSEGIALCSRCIKE